MSRPRAAPLALDSVIVEGEGDLHGIGGYAVQHAGKQGRRRRRNMYVRESGLGEGRGEEGGLNSKVEWR